MHIYEKCYIYQNDYSKEKDLEIYQMGMSKCDSMHSYGPAIRQNYLIHYILDGKGSFKTGETTYELNKGEAFLIYPDLITFYQADEFQPWEYIWLEFNGGESGKIIRDIGLSFDDPIFRPHKEDGSNVNILPSYIQPSESQTEALGMAYLYFDFLIKNTQKKRVSTNNYNVKDEYIKKAVSYIYINYHEDISVEKIAAYCGLDRSYFSRIFKDNVNKTPQEYIVEYRIKKACEFLSALDISIGDTARSVGYSDQLVFTKAFKRVTGKSPSEYKSEKRAIRL